MIKKLLSKNEIKQFLLGVLAVIFGAFGIPGGKHTVKALIYKFKRK